MTVVFYVVLTLHIICCLFLIAVVLLQQGKGQDLASAFGGAGTQTAFGPRGGATVLSRATTILAALFMVTSLALAVTAPRGGSVLERLPGTAPRPSVAPLSTPSAAPSTTASPLAAPSAAPTSAPSAVPSAATPSSPAAQ